MTDELDRPQSSLQPWPRSAENDVEAEQNEIPPWVGKFVWTVAIGAVVLFVLGWLLVLGELALRR